MSLPSPSAPFRLGRFIVDPGLDSIRDSEGESVRLEPKIMEVLLTLARRRGETVSQEELLGEVWQGKFVVDAVVTRAISELRRVLGDDPKAPRYIQTVARRGYRLIADVAPVDGPPAAGEFPDAPRTGEPMPEPTPAAELRAATDGAGGTSSTSAEGPVRRSRSLLFAAAAALALALAVAAWLRTFGTPQPVEQRPAQAAAVPPEAFRLYAQAQRALAGGSCVAHQAIADLDRALELAPTFAEAWEQLGWAKYNLVSSCGESGTAYAEALRAAERALELVPASTQALALKVAVLTETGEAERALELAAPRVRDSPQLAFLAAYAATYNGKLERARGLIEEVAKRDATFFGREGWTPNALLYLDDPARFLALLPPGSSPLVRFYRGYALWRGGSPQSATQELAPAFRERPADPFARLAEALVAILEERRDDARLLLGQLALQRARLAASDGELTFRIAELLAAAGDRERALVEAERAVEQGFFCSRCLAGAPAFATLQGEARYSALLAAARRRETRPSS